MLFPALSEGRAFNAVTAGLRFEVNKYLSLRPEVRYDWFDARVHDQPFARGRTRDQLTGMVEPLFYFWRYQSRSTPFLSVSSTASGSGFRALRLGVLFRAYPLRRLPTAHTPKLISSSL